MRRPLLGLLCSCALLFASAASARADEASKRAKVEQLFVLTRVDTMMSEMMGQVSSAMKATTQEQTEKLQLTPQQQVYADRYTAKVNDIIRRSLSMEALKPVFLKVYMDTYTEEELDGIVAFYQSPAGQAFVSKTPQLMQRSMQVMREQVAAAQPQLDQAQKQLQDEMERDNSKH